MDDSGRHWVGAVEVSGSQRGRGYLELGGYDGGGERDGMVRQLRRVELIESDPIGLYTR